ncbi:MAG: hypothetical protein U0869_17435 [Chloroflexota bacterium]
MEPTEESSEASTEGSAVRRRLDQELGLVRGAIAMVGARGVPSVTVGGLRYGEEIARGLAQEAARAGVTLLHLWRLDCHGCDLKVVRAGSEPLPRPMTRRPARLQGAAGHG